MWKFQYSDELFHYGIKGMKWGVRRYQNTDGTLTAAGKKRRSKDDNDIRVYLKTQNPYRNCTKAPNAVE